MKLSIILVLALMFASCLSPKPATDRLLSKEHTIYVQDSESVELLLDSNRMQANELSFVYKEIWQFDIEGKTLYVTTFNWKYTDSISAGDSVGWYIDGHTTKHLRFNGDQEAREYILTMISQD